MVTHGDVDHDDAHRHPDAPPGPPRRPRWVRISGIIVGLLVAAYALLEISGVGPGPGGHGPGMHSDHGSPTRSTTSGQEQRP